MYTRSCNTLHTNKILTFGTQKYIIELQGGETVSSKIGRPIIGGKKDIDVKVRFDKETHEKLLEYCQKEQVTKAEAIRKSVRLLVEHQKK